jgi:hypothetical protein
VFIVKFMVETQWRPKYLLRGGLVATNDSITSSHVLPVNLPSIYLPDAAQYGNRVAIQMN